MLLVGHQTVFIIHESFNMQMSVWPHLSPAAILPALTGLSRTSRQSRIILYAGCPMPTSSRDKITKKDLYEILLDRE